MDYEKKYKEALERAKKSYVNSIEQGWTCDKAIYEEIFPELKESEDEKMRAMAIKAVYAPEAQSCIKSWEINPDDVIAWLEKQGAQKPIILHNALREGIAHFGITQYQIDNWLKKYADVEKQDEQETSDENDIEYTQIDLFIEKACKWLKDDMLNQNAFQGRLERLEIIDGIIERFKTAMEG